MKRALALISAAAAGILSAAAQTGEIDAIIEKYDVCFNMSSPESGVCEYTVRTRVNNADGASSALFAAYTDIFRELSSFSGEISAGGRVVKKLKAQDLSKVSASSGIADDAFLYVYSPSLKAPYVVEYRYKISCRRGISSFPTFIPLKRPDVLLMSASYNITAPAGTEISYSSPLTPVHATAGKRESWLWTVDCCEGFADEDMRPGLLELVPYVYACPVNFSFAGIKGCQAGWKELGDWLYGLQKDTKDIPEALKTSLREMTADAGSDYEKVKLIYDYLRRTTRYVSVQLGIGGLKPAPASSVCKTGFGDCKALSNYMQSMLAAVGIESEYVIVNTDDRLLLPGYASIGQMNHAMLCVPMGRDSLWVECTNPSYPLGYRHDAIAGHEVVLVTAEGGKKVTVKDYPDSVCTRCEASEVKLNADGSAKLKARRSLRADYMESYIDFAARKADSRRKMLASPYQCLLDNVSLDGVSDNFDTFFTLDEVPRIDVDFSADVPSYAKVTGDRLFVPLNNAGLKLYQSRSERVNDMDIDESMTNIDVIRIELPEGFTAEHVPEDVNLDSPFGQFVSTVSVADGEILVKQTLTMRRGRYPKSAYKDYAAFAKAVSKAYAGRIVLAGGN